MLYYKVMFVSIQFKLEFGNKEETEKALAIMHLQSAPIKPLPSSREEVQPSVSERRLVKTSQMVQRKWKRRTVRLVPVGFAGTILSDTG